MGDSPNARISNRRKSLFQSGKALLGVGRRRTSTPTEKVMPSGIRQLKAVLEEHEDGQRSARASARLTKRERALYDVLCELLTTEKNYVADLRFAVSEYAKPLRGPLGQQKHYDVFANLEQIEQLHGNLEADLRPARACVQAAEMKRASSADVDVDGGGGDGDDKGVAGELAALVASAFQPLLPYFMMYATYCGKYTDAPAQLLEARRKKQVDALVVSKTAEKGGTTLEQMLFRPVQRMCVYPLLFKQALRELDAGSKAGSDASASTLAAFTSCFDTVSKTITLVNENVREQEADARLREVLVTEVSGASHLISPTRRLISEVSLDTRRIDGWLHHRRPCKWYVFNDLLLITKPAGAVAHTAIGNAIGTAIAAKLKVRAEIDLLEVDIASSAGGGDEADEDAPSAASAPSPKHPPKRSAMAKGSSGEGSGSGGRRGVRFASHVQSGPPPQPAAGDSGAKGGGGAEGGGAEGGGGGAGTPRRWMAATHMILDRITGDATPVVGVSPTRSPAAAPSSAWSNVLTTMGGSGSSDDLYGDNEREVIHLVHHGRGGGVYKAWAASEAEASALVEQLTRLQAELQESNQSLRDRKEASHAKRRNKSLFGGRS